MKLFLVIYVLGKVGGFVGPLPYDETECYTHTAEMEAKRDYYVALGYDKNGNTITDRQRSMQFTCERRSEAPELGEMKR